MYKQTINNDSIYQSPSDNFVTLFINLFVDSLFAF